MEAGSVPLLPRSLPSLLTLPRLAVPSLPHSQLLSSLDSLPLRLRHRRRRRGIGDVFRCSVSGGLKPRSNPVADWVKENDDTVRSLPIFFGGFGLVVVLVNRAVSGIAPVADAGSSQSRADLLTLGLAVTNILAGLVWLSVRPKFISKVDPIGVDCRRILPGLPNAVVAELEWVWESLSVATCCRSLVIVYDGNCIFQIGAAAEPPQAGEAVGVDATKLIQGSLYQGILRSGSQSYLANLSLYPGKSELPFLPSNTQAVIMQPLEGKGVIILGGDTIRGFTTADQAWISLIGDKLDVTLAEIMNKKLMPVIKTSDFKEDMEYLARPAQNFEVMYLIKKTNQ
ncbi:COFACTOR ASSEMBLY OF COMPLEX C SUBUNIT B CCB4, chloroplastic-like protein [Drosera capensis]